MSHDYDIAIVGMAGRLPGAQSLDEFWRNLADGRESIARLSDEEITASGVPPSHLSDPRYVKAAPVIEQPGHFDAAFFGYSPMEAKTMDPQHRLMLELAHEAIENAGYVPDTYAGRIGVFVGAALNTYFTTFGLQSRLAEDYIPTLIGNDKDFLATRISYKLNLTGPSVTVQTACSTSLVAVHLASQSLLSEETDMALAGGVSVRIPHRAGYFCDGGGVVSPDGHVRSFDARANGTVFGSGGGVLVLKRLADALADGDNIRAVIKGSAVNNDGSTKAGYTAPSVDSQASAVVEALANAGVDADSITYLEAHGSGTPVGDPIEVRALTKAYRSFTKRSGFCAIGSVKSNVGHLDAAAAVTGMIKVVLALEHRQLPPSINFTRANPEIDFDATPFYVSTELREWTSDGPRRAGVMSTGIGGTNAHVVLEEAPTQPPSNTDSHPQVLFLSARSEAAVDQAAHTLRAFLQGTPSTNIGDVAHTLRVGRKVLPCRRSVVCATTEDAIDALTKKDGTRVSTGRVNETRRPVVFLLPGIGDHYVGMAHGLYESWPVFRQEVDRCSEILEPHLGVDIRTILYPESRTWKQRGADAGVDLKRMLSRGTDSALDPDATTLNKTLHAQPALFTVEYAIARLWESLGITPDVIVGHSMGEYVAACLAGVFSLEDALRLITARAKLVSPQPQGAMLAVPLAEDEVLPLLSDDLSISLINGPRLCVVAGPAEAVTHLETELSERDIITRRVQNAHAFHSRMLDPIVPALTDEVRKVRLENPAIPYISNVTGTWATADEATSPTYWATHATRTARFSDALRELWRIENPVLLEAGPGRTLTVLAMQHPERQDGDVVTVSSVRHEYENRSDGEYLLHGVGRLWVSGAKINHDLLPSDRPRRRIPLPTYPFERQLHWIDAAPRDSDAAQSVLPQASTVDDWFYVPTWKRTASLNERGGRPDQHGGALWLVIGHREGADAGIGSLLEARGHAARFVRFGEQFAYSADGCCELNPANADHYVRLFHELKEEAPPAINVVHLGSLKLGGEELARAVGVANQDRGFYSLIHIAQAIGELGISVPITIGVVSNRLHEVTGEERLDPEMASVLGPCGVIPKEFPNVRCFSVDIPDSLDLGDAPDDLAASLLSEFQGPCNGEVLAYRGKYRWQREYEQIKLQSSAPSEFHANSDRVGRLRRGGIYLITGGTGGIGLAIAKELARDCQAKIVLTKKTPFPPKERWPDVAASEDASAKVQEVAQALLEIERLGAEVEVMVADAADRQQMASVIEATAERFGAIHGVIHAAGIVRAGLMQAKTKEVMESVLAPKVYGTAILFDLLREAQFDVDFLVLFSSITSVITPYAESDYSAANAFLDAFTYFANAHGPLHALTINWPGWREVGQLADLKPQRGLEGWKEAALSRAIATDDGLRAFERALTSNLRQVIVSPTSLDSLLEESREPFDVSTYLSPVQVGDGDVERPTGQENHKDAPTDEVEMALTEVWQSALGIERIGVHDRFSDLGGHSLLAMQIVSRIRSVYQIGCTMREFFEAPTIAELARWIKQRIMAEIEALSDDEAGQLVSTPKRGVGG